VGSPFWCTMIKYSELLSCCPDLVAIILLTFRPTNISLRLLTFILYACFATFILLSASTGNDLRDYTNGCTIARTFFTTSYFFWFTDPLLDFRHESDKAKPTDLPLLKRLYWMACLTFNLRGIGWNSQVLSFLSLFIIIQTLFFEGLAYTSASCPTPLGFHKEHTPPNPLPLHHRGHHTILHPPQSHLLSINLSTPSFPGPFNGFHKHPRVHDNALRGCELGLFRDGSPCRRFWLI